MDQFEAVAERVAREFYPAEPRRNVDGDLVDRMAHAFRDHFAQQTCSNCAHWKGKVVDGNGLMFCEFGIYRVGLWPHDTFSCSLFTAKDR